jgi:multicomponent Na+:H+ antiporter subunit G
VTDFLVNTLALLGSIFVLLAAVGVVRMPDVYMRMSTVTKAGTLGVGLLMIAVVLQLGDFGTVLKVIAILAFGLITSPVAAHAISRAAYFQGAKLWEGTVVDELRGQYEAHFHELSHPEPSETVAAAVLEHQEHPALREDGSQE